ncbi:aminoglycoside phosphotransferase family protein [Kribbella sp.]|uniref:aminoglycoside phosphotransferase family protein n=1 Tax=Kribbella sp. TaxID=1871183 RepID=UPI002D48FDA2|nr:aminoglycoside phosphotransferase family protein [Kribbella sp.]HZX06677.1 aminoglycoside phosphotransferase family protein [Kribbella sp.]
MIPEAFAQITVQREGAAGEAWLAELPGIVEGLLDQWSLQRDGDVLHGQVGVVVPVEGDAVLKVSFPHPGNVHEPDAFEAWGGRGAVKLYERDDARYAMLLERVHASTLAAHGGAAAAIAGDVLRQLTVPAPDGLPRMSDKADEWCEELLKDAAELDHPLPAVVVDQAVAVVDELCRVQPETLVHGDFHARNILRADREPWLVVDPKGYVGDPGFDAAIFLRTRAYYLFIDDGLVGAELLRSLQAELDEFAAASGVDADHIRRWTQLIAVQASFWGRRHGYGRARSGSELDELVRLIDQVAIHWTT